MFFTKRATKKDMHLVKFLYMEALEGHKYIYKEQEMLTFWMLNYATIL